MAGKYTYQRPRASATRSVPSPSISWSRITSAARNAGSDVSYHDPHVPELNGESSVPLEPSGYDCVAIVTAHSGIDYDRLVENAQLVVDFRNATGRNGHVSGKVWKL